MTQNQEPRDMNREEMDEIIDDMVGTLQGDAVINYLERILNSVENVHGLNSLEELKASQMVSSGLLQIIQRFKEKVNSDKDTGGRSEYA